MVGIKAAGQDVTGISLDNVKTQTHKSSEGKELGSGGELISFPEA